jgi:hypothetical protein
VRGGGSGVPSGGGPSGSGPSGGPSGGGPSGGPSGGTGGGGGGGRRSTSPPSSTSSRAPTPPMSGSGPPALTLYTSPAAAARYDGSTSPIPFLIQYEALGRSYHWDEHTLANNIQFHLHGAGKEFYKKLVTTQHINRSLLQIKYIYHGKLYGKLS